MRITFLSNMHNIPYMIAREMRRSGADARVAYLKTANNAYSPETYGARREPWASDIPRGKVMAGLALAAKRISSSDHIIASDSDGYHMLRGMRESGMFRGMKDVPYSVFVHGVEMRSNAFMGGGVGAKWAAHFGGAEHVFHCQPDLEKFGRLLRLRNLRYVPTPIDTELWAPSGAQEKRFEVFHPTSHDWSTKGNDKMISAFGRLARDKKDASLCLVQRGSDFGRSMELARTAGVEDRLGICEYLDHDGLRKMTERACAVADSFGIGVLGMVGLQGLALGRPVLCHINQDEYAAVQKEAPPVMGGPSAEEIHSGLLDAYEGKSREGGREYVLKYHAPARAASIIMAAIGGEDAKVVGAEDDCA